MKRITNGAVVAIALFAGLAAAQLSVQPIPHTPEAPRTLRDPEMVFTNSSNAANSCTSLGGNCFAGAPPSFNNRLHHHKRRRSR